MKLNFNVFLLSSLSNIMCIHLLSCMLSVWTLQTGEKFDIILNIHQITEKSEKNWVLQLQEKKATWSRKATFKH